LRQILDIVTIEILLVVNFNHVAQHFSVHPAGIALHSRYTYFWLSGFNWLSVAYWPVYVDLVGWLIQANKELWVKYALAG